MNELNEAINYYIEEEGLSVQEAIAAVHGQLGDRMDTIASVNIRAQPIQNWTTTRPVNSYRPPYERQIMQPTSPDDINLLNTIDSQIKDLIYTAVILDRQGNTELTFQLITKISGWFLAIAHLTEGIEPNLRILQSIGQDEQTITNLNGLLAHFKTQSTIYRHWTSGL